MAPTPSKLPVMAERPTPKTMSSRLMTMKFMQRGVAAATAAAATASETTSPIAPRTDDDEGSAKKRRRISHASAPSTPTAPLYDQKALEAALEEEDRKRLAAIEKRAAELGDSHWVLDGAPATPNTGSRRPLNIVQVGFAQIDQLGEPSETSPSLEGANLSANGPFRRFNMKKPRACVMWEGGDLQTEANIG
jgi:hypothetical protein